MKPAFDRRFVRHTLAIALPIMLQNGITDFVNMLDNIMVGRIGTDPMTGVSIVNSLLFVWILCIFGGLSGIGIFTAQYCGKRDHDGVRKTFRLQFMLALLLFAAGFVIFRFFGRDMISLYLHEDTGGGSADATMQNALAYLRVMAIGFLPFAVTQAYSTTVRSYGETFAPMAASLLAVLLNLAGNYILIYGKLGAPALGVTGAALATVISRFVEMLCIIWWTHSHADRVPFVRGAYASMRVPRALVVSCIRKGSPLLLNEAMWAGGQAVLTQCYSIRGLSVVSALNISHTIGNVFNVSFIAMGSAIAIIIGQRLGELGESHRRELIAEAWRLITFSVCLCILPGILLFAISWVFPLIYNTTEDIRSLAAGLIRIAGICMPMYAYENAAYFIIRSGGKTIITFLFDSCFCWLLSIPTAYLLAHFTGMPILPMYALVQALGLLKLALATFLVGRGSWVKDITV